MGKCPGESRLSQADLIGMACLLVPIMGLIFATAYLFALWEEKRQKQTWSVLKNLWVSPETTKQQIEEAAKAYFDTCRAEPSAAAEILGGCWCLWAVSSTRMWHKSRSYYADQTVDAWESFKKGDTNHQFPPPVN